MTTDNCPAWFAVEPELWQEPGKLKLDWPTRKLAIYLREAAGAYTADGTDTIANVVLRSKTRIMAELDLTGYQLEKSIQRLRSWPSRRARFIQSYDEKQNIFVLRPLPAVKAGTKFVKVYRWLWEARFVADDVKDIILFTRTRFERKDEQGELFSLRIKGTRQPSIMRCCHVQGTDNGARFKRLQQVVKRLSEAVNGVDGTGLIVVKERSEQNKSAVVRLNDEIPSETAFESLRRLEVTREAPRSNQQNQCEVTREAPRSNQQSQCEVTRDASRSNHASESFFSESVTEHASLPIGDPAPEAALAVKTGGEPSAGSEKAESSILLLTGEEEPFLDPLPESIAAHLDGPARQLLMEVESKTLLQPSRMNPRTLAGEFQALLGENPGLQAVDFIAAIASPDFRGLNQISWGLLFSGEYQNRFLKALAAAADSRLALGDERQESAARLIPALNSPETEKRMEAVQALSQLRKTAPLVELIQHETDEAVIFRAVMALNNYPPEGLQMQDFIPLMERSKDFNPEIRADLKRLILQIKEKLT